MPTFFRWVAKCCYYMGCQMFVLYGLPNAFIIWVAQRFYYMEWPENEHIWDVPNKYVIKRGARPF